MSVLPILTRNDELGIVFVQDERPDGTIVVLQCTAAGGNSGAAAPSHHPNEEEVWYPLAEQLSYSALEHGTRQQFRLVIDTSRLPSGKLAFDIGHFVERAQRAVHEREPIIYLDEETAASWGFEGPQPNAKG